MTILDVLIAMARLRHGEAITPCSTKTGYLLWSDCVKIINGKTYLFYNDINGSTRVVVYPAVES
jgi:hypothetical protein